jgi:hypothetical protein
MFNINLFLNPYSDLYKETCSKCGTEAELEVIELTLELDQARVTRQGISLGEAEPHGFYARVHCFACKEEFDLEDQRVD